MRHDNYGQVILTCDDLVDLLYTNPDLDIGKFVIEDPKIYNDSVKVLHYDAPLLKKYNDRNETVESYDSANQKNWYMPKDYYNLDIEKWCLDQCHTDTQTTRVSMEFGLYRERNLIRLLQYLKFLVDTLRTNKIVWGVGRGSSVASYVLYLIGVHRIDSLQYDLDITEFLK